MLERTAHWGTFDAERWWRPSDLAALPAAPLPGGRAAVAAMDELLAGFCAPGDLLLTRRPLVPALYDGLAEAGITFDTHPLEAADEPALPPAHPPRQHGDGAAAATADALILQDHTALRRIGECGQGAPYAVLADTGSVAQRLGWADRLPSPGAAAAVNSKVWSNELVRDLGLFGAGQVVGSVDGLGAAAAEYGFPVVVKDPYGVSGRDTLEVATPGVLAAIQRRLRRQVDAGKRVELLVQRRYPRRRDFSGHLRIDSSGAWTAVGIQVMDNKGFRYAGSRACDPAFCDLVAARGYYDVLARVAAALAAAGYRGPAGVDSMLLEDGTLLPVLEVNARRSLGLLALRLEERARRQGLHCRLWQVDLAVPAGAGVDNLCAALRRGRLVYTGGTRPGATVLSGSTLGHPGGRVYCALFYRAGEAQALRSAVAAAAATAGFATRDSEEVSHAD